MHLSKELWAFVGQESDTFRATQLHDMTVVVNAFDFMHTILNNSEISPKYGGEYCQMAVKFKAVLNNFRKCKLKPIFVFGGLTERPIDDTPVDVSRLECQIYHLQRFLETEKGTSVHNVYFSFIPVFAKETLVGVLNELKIMHVTSNRDAVKACVNLAAYLRCPVIADGSEFLLYEFENPVGSDYAALIDRFVFLPLRFLSTEPLPLPKSFTSNTTEKTLEVSKQEDNFCLIGHVFCPLISEISRLAYHIRPFFAIYLQPRSDFVAPRMSNARDDSQSRSAKDVTSQLHSHVTSLLQFRTVFDIFESIFLSNSKEDSIAYVEKIVSIANALEINFSEGCHLSEFLMLSVSPQPQRIPTSVGLLTWLVNQQGKVSPKFDWLFQYVEKQTQCLSGIANFFLNIPPNAMHLYRSGLISPVMLSRLFAKTWLLYPAMENISRDSLTDCSVDLRFLYYCLALGFTYQCGITPLNTDKLIEISRSRSKGIKSQTINLKELFLPLSADPYSLCSYFINQYIGYTPRRGLSPAWLEAVALTLVIWYTNTDKLKSETFDIFEHPPALSVAMCVCAIVSSSYSLENIFDHLTALSKKIEENKCGSLTTLFNIDIIHELGQIQLVYMSLLSIIRFLDLLMITNGSAEFSKSAEQSFNVMEFLPSWVVFSCCSLLHHMSASLVRQSPEERRMSAAKTWFSLLCTQLSELETSIDVFSKIINLIQEMSGVVHTVQFNSSITIPPENTKLREFEQTALRGRFQRGASRIFGRGNQGCQKPEIKAPPPSHIQFPQQNNNISRSGFVQCDRSPDLNSRSSNNYSFDRRRPIGAPARLRSNRSTVRTGHIARGSRFESTGAGPSRLSSTYQKTRTNESSMWDKQAIDAAVNQLSTMNLN